MTVQYIDIVKHPKNKSVSYSSALGEFGKKSFYSRGLKRLFDLVLVLASLPIVVPVVLILALLVALDGGLPFYRQTRIGRNGRIFTMWKLRSMVPDAEHRLEQHLDTDDSARAEWNCTQKLKDDPRITTFGRVLRKSSMDELPQLWNVLRGDMSLIGPRPMMPEQQELYPGPIYYGMRPGITGLWQISDRNECAFEARATYDMRYCHSVSFFSDLSILMQTVRVVLRGTGY